MVDVWDWTFRQLKVANLLGQGRLPLLPAAEVRVARRVDGLAHDHALRPERRPGRRPPPRAARLRRDGPSAGRRWARSATTRSCSGSPPKATSSPCSPTAGRSSRGPTTSPRRGRSMPSSSGADALAWTGCGASLRPQRSDTLGRELRTASTHDLPRQRRDQLPQARAGLPGARPIRPDEPGESRAAPGTAWRSPPSSSSTRRATRSTSSSGARRPSAGSSR